MKLADKIEHINENDVLNAGREKINKFAIDPAMRAEGNSLDTKKEVTEFKENTTKKINENKQIVDEAKMISDNVNARLDNVLANEMQDGEIIDARKPLSLDPFASLGARLNDMDEYINMLKNVSTFKTVTELITVYTTKLKIGRLYYCYGYYKYGIGRGLWECSSKPKDINIEIRDNLYLNLLSNQNIATSAGLSNEGHLISEKIITQFLKANKGNELYFEDGMYNIEVPLKLPLNSDKSINIKFSDGSILKTEKNLRALIELGVTDAELSDQENLLQNKTKPSFVTGGVLEAENCEFGIYYNTAKRLVNIQNMTIKNFKTTGIYMTRDSEFNPDPSFESVDAKFTNLFINGKSSGVDGTFGIWTDDKAYDLKIYETFIYGVKTGIHYGSAGLYADNVHIFVVQNNVDSGHKFDDTTGIEFGVAGNNYLSNYYSDGNSTSIKFIVDDIKLAGVNYMIGKWHDQGNLVGFELQREAELHLTDIFFGNKSEDDIFIKKGNDTLGTRRKIEILNFSSNKINYNKNDQILRMRHLKENYFQLGEGTVDIPINTKTLILLDLKMWGAKKYIVTVKHNLYEIIANPFSNDMYVIKPLNSIDSSNKVTFYFSQDERFAYLEISSNAQLDASLIKISETTCTGDFFRPKNVYSISKLSDYHSQNSIKWYSDI